MRCRALPASAILAAGLLGARTASAQAVRYEVSVTSALAHLYHVKAEFPTVGKDTLFVALPAWSPGNYEIQNYARYLRHFTAQGPDGTALFWDRADKTTWRIAVAKQSSVTVAFDFLADTIDLALARLLPDFGQFLGTNLFLLEPGHLDRPAEVRFALPPGWQVTTALHGTGMGPYTAADYHELADAETFVGHFSLDSALVENKWVRLAVWPASSYSPAVARSLRGSLEQIAKSEDRMMGGPPYDEYTVFFTVISEPISFGGGLEHASSQFDIMPANAFADATGTLGDFIVPLMAHEYFHLWNVKRIRPAAMVPYDYLHEQYTPLLWWSEGVTDYYADLTALRSGLWTTDQFLHNTMTDIEQVETTPEPWSEEDGSIATWINELYDNSSQLYYPKGALTGMLLDVAMRDATNDAHSLDDVMRALYHRFGEKGRGFTTDDLLGLFREFGVPDVDDFYTRYIRGREPLPYEKILPAAGFTVRTHTTSVPFLGVTAPLSDQGRWVVQDVEPGSAAEDAGIQPGDVLVQVGDVTPRSDMDWTVEFRQHYAGHAGAPLALTVERAGTQVSLTTTVRERSVTTYQLSQNPTPTPKQARLWRGLTTGITGN
ncbi:MAG TPA: PDZ domain-containing protein [Gemmatimonadales bacterium]|nr:PDZ domain-containing protein [Gemmatimonadales bacterium]